MTGSWQRLSLLRGRRAALGTLRGTSLEANRSFQGWAHCGTVSCARTRVAAAGPIRELLVSAGKGAGGDSQAVLTGGTTAPIMPSLSRQPFAQQVMGFVRLVSRTDRVGGLL